MLHFIKSPYTVKPSFDTIIDSKNHALVVALLSYLLFMEYAQVNWENFNLLFTLFRLTKSIYANFPATFCILRLYSSSFNDFLFMFAKYVIDVFYYQILLHGLLNHVSCKISHLLSLFYVDSTQFKSSMFFLLLISNVLLFLQCLISANNVINHLIILIRYLNEW